MRSSLCLTAACGMQTRLAEMNDELQELLTKSEVLGEQGDVDGAQAAAAQAEQLRVRDTFIASDVCVLAPTVVTYIYRLGRMCGVCLDSKLFAELHPHGRVDKLHRASPPNVLAFTGAFSILAMTSGA